MDKVFAVENRATRERIKGFTGLLSDFGNERLSSIPSGFDPIFSGTDYITFSERDAKRLVKALDGFEAVETERMKKDYDFDFPESNYSVFLTDGSHYPRFVGGAARVGEIIAMLNSLSLVFKSNSVFTVIG